MVFIGILISYPSSTAINQTEKLLLTLSFILVCLFGFSCAISPRWCKRYFTISSQSYHHSSKKHHHFFIGHHPNCSEFQTHTLSIKNKVYCAGCLGLAIGCILSIILMIIYYQYPISSTTLWYSLIILGFFLIFLVYSENSLSLRNSVFHCLINLLLILSFFFIMVSVLEITHNIVFSIIALLFSFLWLETRIQISRYQHTSICSNCPKECKQYKS
jgi:hypothetical protein